MLLDTLPDEFHSAIKKMNENKMKKVMDLMKVRIHYYSDLCKHTYFFKEPSYDNKIS